jgi:hypothetical protein
MATTTRRKTTTEKGLGWRHRQALETLFDHLNDGSPCAWCGRPRYRDRTKNYDYKPGSTNPANGQLQGDHSKLSRSEAAARGIPIPPADRLLHGECNRQRGDGTNDHLAANAAPVSQTNELLMAWPW